MTPRLTAALAAVLLLFSVFPVLGQQSATYAEEYALFQQAQAETDGAKQKALVLSFVQKFKSSELDPNISYLYAQQLERYRQSGDWAKLTAEAEAFLQHRPTDKTAAGMATEGYQKLGQPQKLVQFGTRLYNQAPSAATAYLVAKAYQSMNDAPNFQKWAEKTLQHAPNNAEMLVEMVNMYWSAGDLQKASDFGAKAVKGLQNSPNDKQTNVVRAFAHRAIGENAYVNGDMATAQKEFQQATTLDPMNDFGHLRLGYCQWRANRIDEAIRSFAKAVALKGGSAKEARQELYNLLKQRYGSTESATKVIEAARKELGAP